MKKLLLFIIIGIWFWGTPMFLFSQNGIDYTQQYAQLKNSIQQRFFITDSNYYREHAFHVKGDRPVSYLWPLCALFEAVHEGGTIENSFKDFETVFSIVRKYHNDKPPAPGYASYSEEFGGGTRFYDDNQWIAITAMDAYERTKDTAWLNRGEEIYQFMMTGYDTVSGGGLYWEEGNHKTKNTCSNGPGIILALQLYKATQNKKYLHVALDLYHWVNKYLKNEDHLYYDNLQIPSMKINKRVYSYNTGTMLQANIYLFEVTKETSYLQEANRIAESAKQYFLREGAFKDNYWFNAVLLRGFQHLLKHNRDTKYIVAFQIALNAALENKKYNKQNLVANGGLLEMVARFARMQQKGIIK